MDYVHCRIDFTVQEQWSSFMVSAQQLHVILHLLSSIRCFIFWEVFNHHDISGIRQLDQILAYRTKMFLFMSFYVVWITDRFILELQIGSHLWMCQKWKKYLSTTQIYFFLHIQVYSQLECTQNTPNLKICFNIVVFYDYFSLIEYMHSLYLVSVWILMWIVTYKIYIAMVITVMRIIQQFVSS